MMMMMMMMQPVHWRVFSEQSLVVSSAKTIDRSDMERKSAFELIYNATTTPLDLSMTNLFLKLYLIKLLNV